MQFVTGALVAVILLTGGPPPSSDVGFGGANSGTTHVGVADGAEVTIEAQRPGAAAPEPPDSENFSRGGSNSSTGVRGGSQANRPLTDWVATATGDLGGTAPAPCVRSSAQIPCAAPSPASPTASTVSTAGPRVPTLTDIASFRPSTPSLTVEPGSFGIAGRPTNFVVSATPQALTGTLFGLPVTVRFTPAAYRFDYGDGTTNTTHTGGSTWKAGHEPLFTPTGTSHVYRRKGQVTVRVAVAYSAQVSFAGYPGWYDVDGYVTANAPEKQFRIYVAHTVLVEHTCDEDPRGPGCPGTAP